VIRQQGAQPCSAVPHTRRRGRGGATDLAWPGTAAEPASVSRLHPL